MTRKLIGYRVRQADGEWAAGASGLPLVFTTPDRRIFSKGEAVIPYYVRPSTSKRLAKAEADVAHLLDRAEKAESEVRRYQAALANEEAVAKGHNDRLAAVNADIDKCRAELAEANEAIRHESTARGTYFDELQAAKREIVTLRAVVDEVDETFAHPQPAPESDATSERADVVAYERGWLDAINALLVECVKRRDAFREAAKTTDREKWAEYLTIAIENDQLCGQLRDRIEDRKNLHVRAKGG